MNLNFNEFLEERFLKDSQDLLSIFLEYRQSIKSTDEEWSEPRQDEPEGLNEDFFLLGGVKATFFYGRYAM
jgi:hypothetical protein